MRVSREASNPHPSTVAIGIGVGEIEEILDQAIKLADDLENRGQKVGLDLVAEKRLRGLIEDIEQVLDDLSGELQILEGWGQRGPATSNLLASRGCLRYLRGFVHQVGDALQQFRETKSPKDLERLREDCHELRREAEGIRRVVRKVIH